ncbi:putative integral membrane protein [Isoptericola jiangsuensis]|uniref:Putative integral membrane protein n=1 Tax=Isoptericola jiangsuensis TaxID=548579 RepID=A0A2A9ERK3_9MICO|nr:lipopolysaccharide assembly protein LapA domain-containing protein [Isoptericola jiangsuensis]PFG41498.1 putative integral membrane protein [Isoptericola jiangsuensis]
MATTPPTRLTSAVNGSPRRSVTGTSQVLPDNRGSVRSPRSRVGALWVGICVAALVLVALIVFMLQNTKPVLVTFLGLQGSVPLAVALLIAGVGVGVIALVIGTIRITQLRRRLHDRG